MPIYEYQCQGCGNRSEVIQRLSDPPLTTCEECGGTLKKLISAPAFQFKGTGWYVTDYPNSKEGKRKDDSGDGDDSSKSSDDKASTKSSDSGGSDKSGDSSSSKSSTSDSKTSTSKSEKPAAKKEP